MWTDNQVYLLIQIVEVTQVKRYIVRSKEKQRQLSMAGKYCEKICMEDVSSVNLSFAEAGSHWYA